MTQEEYLGEQGRACPHCGSYNTHHTEGPELGDLETDLALATVECHDCGKEWKQEWKLAGYRTIVPPEVSKFEAAMALVNTLAALRKDGEGDDGDGDDFVLENDDAVDQLHDAISTARSIAGKE